LAKTGERPLKLEILLALCCVREGKRTQQQVPFLFYSERLPRFGDAVTREGSESLSFPGKKITGVSQRKEEAC